MAGRYAPLPPRVQPRTSTDVGRAEQASFGHGVFAAVVGATVSKREGA
jgi:hypothetical protein